MLGDGVGFLGEGGVNRKNQSHEKKACNEAFVGEIGHA